MTSLYQQITTAWEASGNDIEKPPHLQPLDDIARNLDKQLSDMFREPLGMWEEGLISATELLDKLNHLAHKEN